MKTQYHDKDARAQTKIPYGYCHCGCGQKTALAKKGNRRRGIVAGEPNKYIPYHHLKSKPMGPDSPIWRGGIRLSGKSKNYVSVYAPGHPHSVRRLVPRSKLVVEAILGKILPPKAVVHHIDHNGLNDAHNNLVVCEDVAYHNLIHMRERALAVCGNPNWRKCYICKEYDNPKNLYISACKSNVVHRSCAHKKYLERRKCAEYGAYVPSPGEEN